MKTECDVGKERPKVGDFEFFVDGDDLQRLQRAVGQCGRRRGVGERAVGAFRDRSQLLGTGSGEAIGGGRSSCAILAVGRPSRGRGSGQSQCRSENLGDLSHRIEWADVWVRRVLIGYVVETGKKKMRMLLNGGVVRGDEVMIFWKGTKDEMVIYPLLAICFYFIPAPLDSR